MAEMSEIGVFTPRQARLLWDEYLRRQQASYNVTNNYNVTKNTYETSPHRVFVKNTSSEIIPPYACMRITGVEVVGGRTAIKVEKPTSVDGEFLFNSQFSIAIPSGTETGVGWAYRFGQVLMLGDEPSIGTGVEYLPIVASWEIEEGAGPFVVFGRHDANVRAITGRFGSGGGGGGGSAGSCACVCIANGDIIVHGIETTSRWSFDMTAQIFKQTHGSITFPAGTYVVVWDSGTSTWALDIGADLTAAYLNGSDATSATTMDGTLTLTWSALGAALSLQLCVDGTIPAPSGS